MRYVLCRIKLQGVLTMSFVPQEINKSVCPVCCGANGYWASHWQDRQTGIIIYGEEGRDKALASLGFTPGSGLVLSDENRQALKEFDQRFEYKGTLQCPRCAPSRRQTLALKQKEEPEMKPQVKKRTDNVRRFRDYRIPEEK